MIAYFLDSNRHFSHTKDVMEGIISTDFTWKPTIATTAGNTIEGAASPMIADISKGFDLVAVSLTDWRLF